MTASGGRLASTSDGFGSKASVRPRLRQTACWSKGSSTPTASLRRRSSA